MFISPANYQQSIHCNVCGNNEQIVKARFGCCAEIEIEYEQHTFFFLTCSNKCGINSNVRNLFKQVK